MNNQGKTCLDLAKDRNKTSVLRVLERSESQATGSSISMATGGNSQATGGGNNR